MSDNYVLLKKTTMILEVDEEKKPTWVIVREGIKLSEAVATKESNPGTYKILEQSNTEDSQ